MEGKANHPRRAWHFYGSAEVGVGSSKLSKAGLLFYLRHMSRWVMNCLSFWSCGYGERPLWTVAWSPVLIGSFTVLYQVTRSVERTGRGGPCWIDSLLYSSATFSTMNFSDITVMTDTGRIFTVVEALLGIATLALLMFAVGNRISRQ